MSTHCLVGNLAGQAGFTYVPSNPFAARSQVDPLRNPSPMTRRSYYTWSTSGGTMDSHESQNSPQNLENNSASSSVTTAVDDPVEMTASISDASNDSAETNPSETKQTEIEQLLTTMHDALKDLAEHFSSTVNHIGSLLSSQAHPSQGSAEAEPSAAVEVADEPAAEAEPSAEAEVAPAEVTESDSPVEVEVASAEVAEAEPSTEAEITEEPAAEVEVAEAEAAAEAESPATVEEEEVEQVQIVGQDGSGDVSASQLAVEVDEAAESADAEPVALANVDEVLVEAPPEEVPETLAELVPEAASTEAAADDGDAATVTESDGESLVVSAEEEQADTISAEEEQADTDTGAAADDIVGEETPSPIEEANETGGDSPPVPEEAAPVQQESTD
jgi:hypothetical protein